MGKRYMIGLVAASAMLPALVFAAPALKTQQAKLSYSMGFSTGMALSKHQIKLVIPAYTAGLNAAMSGQSPAMPEADMMKAIMAFQAEQSKKINSEHKDMSEKNLAEGKAFLEKNKTKPGIQVMPSGLQYQVITAGEGQSPTMADKVTVNYEGTLLDGTVFDSSYKRNKPITFPVGGVIKGWQEALTHMKPGATWVVYIPSDLAYGQAGAPGGAIGPNAVLRFKINLISVDTQG